MGGEGTVSPSSLLEALIGRARETVITTRRGRAAGDDPRGARRLSRLGALGSTWRRRSSSALEETVEGKPFVDPGHTRREEEALRGSCSRHERERPLRVVDAPAESRRDVIIRETDAAGLRHLLVVPETHAPRGARPLVGFFGRPRTTLRPACSSTSRSSSWAA